MIFLAIVPGLSAGDFASLQVGAIAGLYAFVLTIYGVGQFGTTIHGQNLIRASPGSPMILSSSSVEKRILVVG
jgi:hypothetical protein